MSRCTARDDGGRRCEKEAGHDAPDEFGGVEMHSHGRCAWGELVADDTAPAASSPQDGER